MKMNLFDWMAMVLLVVGGINWGLVGLFDFDLVALMFGDMTGLSRFVYAFVGICAVYLVLEALTKLRKQTPTTPTHA